MSAEALPLAPAVGFGVAPQFFRPNVAGIESNPAKVAERRAAEQRMQAFNHAVHALRSAAEALHRFKALDATGHLTAGIEHFDAHITRAEDAADTLLAMGEAFAKEWKL